MLDWTCIRIANCFYSRKGKLLIEFLMIHPTYLSSTVEINSEMNHSGATPQSTVK